MTLHLMCKVLRDDSHNFFACDITVLPSSRPAAPNSIELIPYGKIVYQQTLQALQKY